MKELAVFISKLLSTVVHIFGYGVTFLLPMPPILLPIYAQSAVYQQHEQGTVSACHVETNTVCVHCYCPQCTCTHCAFPSSTAGLSGACGRMRPPHTHFQNSAICLSACNFLYMCISESSHSCTHVYSSHCGLIIVRFSSLNVKY